MLPLSVAVFSRWAAEPDRGLCCWHTGFIWPRICFNFAEASRLALEVGAAQQAESALIC